MSDSESGMQALMPSDEDVVFYQRNGYYGEGHIAICTHYNAATKAAFEMFRDAYRGQGPQGISLALDNPGMGPH